MDDSVAARNWRIDKARQMASGLRIVVKQEDVTQSEVISIKVTEYPAYISPVATRKSGGGYEPFDLDDETAQQELSKNRLVCSLRRGLTVTVVRLKILV